MDIQERFSHKVPTNAQSVSLSVLRQHFATLATIVEGEVPKGEYRTLAIEALEEAAMWANKGIMHG
jgi:hypothetical protein